jgi:hypothetical protein
MKSFTTTFLCRAFLLLLPLSSALASRSLDAVRVKGEVRLDGVLDDAAWQRPGSGGFRQFDPKSGEPATEKTEVWVAYDDAALYIAARLYDDDPTGIARNFGRRDAGIASDWFWVGIDAYHDGRNGAFFVVNPVGTVRDGILFEDTEQDESWDGIWERSVVIDDKGWTVEMRIPYSQLRFEQRDEQVWGINFKRTIWRKGEESHFELMPREEHGLVSRFAELRGLVGIDPPSRVEVLPYVVSGSRFLQHDPDDPFMSGNDMFVDAGADVRLGIGSNMTLDATINPDFGQVEVDPAVLNLSAFETFYQEKRPFFVEGSGIFAFGGGGGGFGWFNPTYFYTRRVGRPPQGFVTHDGFVDAPDRTTILGAAKLTGKFSEGWSTGVLSALTSSETAVVDSLGTRFEERVEPLTSYNVVRVRGESDDGAQGIGMLGTATVRNLPDEGLLPILLARNAFSFGVDGYRFLDEQRGWSLSGWGGVSHVNGSRERITLLQRSPQRYFQQPDATHLQVDPDATSLTGWSGRVQLNKRSGNLRLGAALGAISPGFEANDIGFSGRADYINWHLTGDYNWFEPDGVFRHKFAHAHVYQSYDFGGTALNAAYGLSVGGQLESFWGFDASLDYTPLTYDTRSTRGGPMMDGPAGWFGNASMYTDFREKVSGAMYGGGSTSPDDIWDFYCGATLTVRPADEVQLSIGPNWSRNFTHAGYIGTFADPAMSATYGARYVFADLMQNTLSAEIRLDWTFTPELSLQIFAQPYFTTGDYSGFKELARPKTYDFNTFGNGSSTIAQEGARYTVDPDGEGASEAFSFRNPDFNYKSLRGTAVLRWEYLPGSTLYLVWTHQRENVADPGSMRLSRDFGSLFKADSDNIVMLKAVYWIG